MITLDMPSTGAKMHPTKKEELRIASRDAVALYVLENPLKEKKTEYVPLGINDWCGGVN